MGRFVPISLVIEVDPQWITEQPDQGILPEDMTMLTHDSRIFLEQAIAKLNDLPISMVPPENRGYKPRLDRVLLHETIHFWQQAAATFMIRIAEEDWARMRAFERGGTAEPAGPYRTEYFRIYPEAGYSARDLQECLARFWEILIFNPIRLIEIDLENPKRDLPFSLQTRFKSLLEQGSQDAIFPLAMEVAAGRYGKPFLELVRRTSPYVAAGLFPLAGYFAFQTEHPVPFFKALVARTLSELENGATSKDLDISYKGIRLLAEALYKETAGRPLVLGMNALRDSPLVENPGYKYVLAKTQAFVGWARQVQHFAQANPNFPEQISSQADRVSRRFHETAAYVLGAQFPAESVDSSDFFRGYQNSVSSFLADPEAPGHIADFLVACPGSHSLYLLLRQHLMPPCVRLPDGRLMSARFIEPGPMYQNFWSPWSPLKHIQDPNVFDDRLRLIQSRAELTHVAEPCLDVDRRWRRFREACRGF